MGHVLVSRTGGVTTSGLIVETEAYLGRGDPASRASRKRTPLNEIMWDRGGLTFIYMVHGNWLLNFTADRPGVPGAVLIRALQPESGIATMRRRRKCADVLELTSGPGKLTQALGITKRHHGVDVTQAASPVVVIRGPRRSLDIASSHRIGVRADLDRPLRFFLRGCPFVSRAKPRATRSL